MDLGVRIALAAHGLLGVLDEEHEYMPTGGWEVAHDLGRWWDAMLRAEEAIGFAIPAELEAASLRNLQLLTDNPDRLLMNRSDVPWLTERARINMHNLRETLLAYGGLVRRRRNLWARESALELVRSIDHALQPDGRLDFARLGSWGQVPMTTDGSHGEGAPGVWFDRTATTGRALEGLVRLYECTGEEPVIGLADRIARHHLASSMSEDGLVRPEIIDPENVGHNHSYHGTLRGLLLYGRLTGQRRYIDLVEATYRNGVRNRIVKESGWTSHDLGKLRFPNEHGDPVSDPASSGDSAQLALWLALFSGSDDLFDDVERLVRARLAPSQLTREEVEANPGQPFAPRSIGAWSIHGPSHAGKGCTPDVHAAVLHTLCDIQQSVVTRHATCTRVNLHFDTHDEDVDVVCRRETDAVVTMRMNRRTDLLVRVPGWVADSAVRLVVDGACEAVRKTGAYLRIDKTRLHPGSIVEMTFPLPERETEEVMPSGRTYRFRWRGDEIIGVSPQEDSGLPFYPGL